jgi:hypothetical protein
MAGLSKRTPPRVSQACRGTKTIHELNGDLPERAGHGELGSCGVLGGFGGNTKFELVGEPLETILGVEVPDYLAEL